MVASRFENALFSRPWLAQVGRYPGMPVQEMAPMPASPAVAAPPPQVNAPLQVMAGAVPASLLQGGGFGEGYGGGGIDPANSGYGLSTDFGSWAGNILSALGMLTGPLGAMATGARIAGTMIADPARANVYGSLPDLISWSGFGGDSLSPAAQAAIENAGSIIGAPPGSAQGWAGSIEHVSPGTLSAVGDAADYGSAAQSQADVDAAMFAGDPTATMSSGSWGGGGQGGYNDGSAQWRYGGYTGAGPDGRVQKWQPAGTVHEGEVVMSNEAVRKHGRKKLERMNEMAAPRTNKLARLAGR